MQKNKGTTETGGHGLSPILTVEDLSVSFATETGRVKAVEEVGFTLSKGSTLGLVGESGCGKSVTALSVMRLLPKPAGRVESGRILFDGMDILSLPAEEMHQIRGKRMAMIFQEPMTALNPVQRIGRQLEEVYKLHFPDMTDPETLEASTAILDKVGIPEPKMRLGEYPHQISGGTRQRVMIAMALACRPDILIADEPTTAIDVTIQAQILDLMAALQAETKMALLFITHDLGVIAEICDRVVVMYAGKVVETAPVKALFKNPAHPYTRGLLRSIPRLGQKRKTELSVIKGMVPALGQWPRGCRFQNRCPRAQEICGQGQPPLKEVGGNHRAACFFA